MKLACDKFLSSILETNLLTTSSETLKPIQDQIQELEASSQQVKFEYSPESIEIAIREVGDFVIFYGNMCKENNTQQESEASGVVSEVVNSKFSSYEIMQTPIPGLCGILNVGNYSYINSILQCLIHTPLISEYFMKQLHTESSTRKHVELFQSIFDHICSGARTCFDINRDILNQFAFLSPSSDAYTFLTSLVTCLHKEMNTVVALDIDMHQSSSNDTKVSQLAWDLHSLCNQSIISDTIHGQYKSIETCQSCGSETFSFNIFTSLSIPLYLEIPKGDDTRNIKFTLILINPFAKPIVTEVRVKKKALISDLCLAISFISEVGRIT
ncbi:Ubiquitin carboxyl-terminal hydrolase 4 isoform X3 [Oopsacas minuta]|uniref:ubiquitinyl hydrolase 1 n=1 Tax=Oopsacas minuta TaxID=111878 RepID=A0AAV7JBF8_9METZ|nr:Ubiquitin carboxyl-terminal hydrolase 4 isoform X3 [Oopsacas minuta]